MLESRRNCFDIISLYCFLNISIEVLYFFACIQMSLLFSDSICNIELLEDATPIKRDINFNKNIMINCHQTSMKLALLDYIVVKSFENFHESHLLRMIKTI